ncbi:MarR family winged helix-turn-helix transcriptional regulator [Alkalihalobacillus sp. AL-G]|uniref:MarR family winged helix-turn-helix transcriptional regulator n=1 Tax=Alkalihalobacillus sp. AL-G TaxID=2926399 RepID=UPI00272B2D62|nr:MarR family transcriptional regulator [Alkalihalobacillus sp. AL-G]WLD92746.1 MarR family transcriptional regulator [Alkalihalobacillus sp. AL-G]
MINRQQLILDLEKSFRTVFRMFRRELNDLFQEEITSTEFTYLKFIMEKNQVMTSMLSQEFNVSTSHITAVTDRLVQRELVTRRRAEDDRRVIYLCITEKGQKIVELLEVRKHEYMEEKFQQLSDEEMENLLQLFSKIT